MSTTSSKGLRCLHYSRVHYQLKRSSNPSLHCLALFVSTWMLSTRSPSVQGRSTGGAAQEKVAEQHGMNVVKEIERINQREAALGVGAGASWHDEYAHSAYIFASGLDHELSEADIISIFEQYGKIVDLNRVRDKKTGNPKGFAFMAYEDQRSTILAVDNLNGAMVSGRTLRVDHVKEYKPPKKEKKKEDEEGEEGEEKEEEEEEEQEDDNRKRAAARKEEAEPKRQRILEDERGEENRRMGRVKEEDQEDKDRHQRRDRERDRDRNRNRDRDREGRNRDGDRDREYRDRDGDRERDKDRDRDRHRESYRARDRDRDRDRGRYSRSPSNERRSDDSRRRR